MIDIDRRTGQKIDDVDYLISRITQILSTPFGGRVKRPKFGSRVREYLNHNLSDHTLMQIQAATLESFYIVGNGVDDFKPTRCVATRASYGVNIQLWGVRNRRLINIEVPIHVSA